MKGRRTALDSSLGIGGSHHLHSDEERDRDGEAEEEDVGFCIVIHLEDAIGRKLSKLEGF